MSSDLDLRKFFDFDESDLVANRKGQVTQKQKRPLKRSTIPAGVQVTGRDGGATIYAMTPVGGETLTIRDSDMVEAIAEVARAHAAPAPARRRRRLPLVPLLVLAALATAAGFAPGLIRAQAARLVPPEKAEEFGDRMLLGVMEARGGSCNEPAGRRALGRLALEIDPASPPRLRVLDLGAAPAVALPGGTVQIDRTALARAAEPAEVAGWATAALAADPVAALMRAAGPISDLRYIFTGALGEPALERATRAVLAPPAAPAVATPSVKTDLSAAEWDALRDACG
jgi:hypothetical protein